MSYELCFSEDFFTGEESIENIEVSKKPTNILQALVSLAATDKKYFVEMIIELLGANYAIYKDQPIGESVYYELLDKIRAVNSCSDLSSPVEVWIDSEGFYTVDIYESKGE